MGCCRKMIIRFLIGLAIYDCITDWMLYTERKDQICDLCEEVDASIHKQTADSLKAMFAFSMIGTYCLYVEFFNLLFELGSNAIFDPAILCVSFFVVEELPLAVLRWVIRDFTEKPVDFLGYSTSIIGLISPLGRIFVLTIKCCCCDCCKDEKEPIVKWENKWCKGFAIVVTGIIVFIFNLLNWFDVASGVKSCE